MSDLRPVDPNTGKPLEPRAQPGYYPGFSTLAQQRYWDATTRKVVLDRVNEIPPFRFFDAEQARLLTAICDRIIPQDDRDDAHRIPIAPQIDKKLYENITDGYRHQEMPPQREAFVLGLQAIDEIARTVHGCAFPDLDAEVQEELLRSLHDAKPQGAHEIWKRMPVHRFWTVLVKGCIHAYYAHPYAWDEIGFGGPAYPRAYMRLEHGQPEPWETNEHRYEWAPPPWSVSHVYEPVAGEHGQYASPGQGGTH